MIQRTSGIGSKSIRDLKNRAMQIAATDFKRKHGKPVLAGEKARLAKFLPSTKRGLEAYVNNKPGSRTMTHYRLAKPLQ